MKRYSRLVAGVFALLCSHSFAQQKYAVSGTVKDKTSGEALIGASVYLREMPKYGVASNTYGFYSITAPAGNYTLVVSFAGYQSDSVKLILNKNISYTVELFRMVDSLQEVVVNASKTNGNVSNPIMGVQKISIRDIKTIPVIFGAQDLLKTIQLLPGVQSGGDGSSGFYVRGGGADQNLILLDGATVYNPFHLLGFFSAFNSDAIKDVTLYKGAVPAEYGGRLSSVLDVTMKDGDAKQFQGSGGIGLIASRINLEGPIGNKENGSYIVSARRTYADMFLKLSRDTDINKSTLYFYDLNAKANYRFGSKDQIFLSGYFGKDNFGMSNTFGMNYGNATATLRWNHVFNNRLFANTSIIYSKYNYAVNINSTANYVTNSTSSNSSISLTSYIQDAYFKEDMQYYAGEGSKINFGVEVIHHTTSPGVISAYGNSNFNSLNLQNRRALESAVYFSHYLTLSDKLNLNYGLRASLFTMLGPGTFYTYDSLGNTIDSSVYSSGKAVVNYFNLEPRASVNYKLTDNSSLKFSYTRTSQNLHLLSNSTYLNPTDIWIPSSNNVKPETSDQISFGYYRNFKDDRYEFSSEIYYRDLQHQIDYKNGAQLIANEYVESQLIFGKGRAYGLELFLKKKYGKLTGWISYTLSRTERQFTGVNDGSWYPANQDRTHDISVVGIYKLNKKWTLSSDFVYYTGNAVTWPSGKYEVDGRVAFIYTERNGYRMPPYNRLDFSATLQGKKTKKFDSNWVFSLYNVYGRENPYLLNFEQDPNNPNKTIAQQIALFRWVPSVTYNFNF
jgi:hypothetical protein